MDELAEHEAFLRAVFDYPDDDTPRLVYADFLEEHGASDRAELIRVMCEWERADTAQRARLHARAAELNALLGYPPDRWLERGFAPPGVIAIVPDDLVDPVAFRRRVVVEHPEWYGATVLAIEPGRALFPDELPVLFGLPFTQKATEWDLGGHTEEIAAGPQTEDSGTYGLIDMKERPVMSLAGVEALAKCRAAQRLRVLDLTYNRLDNDAARAIVGSPHLVNLTRLELKQGNRFSGRMWQELIAQFTEQVVG